MAALGILEAKEGESSVGRFTFKARESTVVEGVVQLTVTLRPKK